MHSTSVRKTLSAQPEIQYVGFFSLFGLLVRIIDNVCVCIICTHLCTIYAPLSSGPTYFRQEARRATAERVVWHSLACRMRMAFRSAFS